MRSSLDGDKDPKHRDAARRRKVGIRIIAHETAGWTMRLCRTGMGGQRQGQIGGFPHGRRLARAVRLGSCGPHNGTDLAEKADTAMDESDEDRIDAAELLAEQNPRAAAEAFSAIACDRAVGDEVRLSAAELLSDVDPDAAGPACLAIARDRTVGDEVRLSAAERLADVNPRAAAPACLAIACDQAVGDEVRLSAAELLVDVDPGAAAPACVAIARDQTVGDEVRSSAAERLAGLATLRPGTGA